jgi:hypothetical protein
MVDHEPKVGISIMLRVRVQRDVYSANGNTITDPEKVVIWVVPLYSLQDHEQVHGLALMSNPDGYLLAQVISGGFRVKKGVEEVVQQIAADSVVLVNLVLLDVPQYEAASAVVCCECVTGHCELTQVSHGFENGSNVLRGTVLAGTLRLGLDSLITVVNLKLNHAKLSVGGPDRNKDDLTQSGV